MKSPITSQRTRSNEFDEDSSREVDRTQRDRSIEREPITSQRTRSGDTGHSDTDFHQSPDKSRTVLNEQRRSESPVRHRTKADPSPARNRPVSAYDYNYSNRERSPSPDFAETGIVPTNQTPKPFSRKEIQETIDSVKQRWFSGPEAKPGDVTFQKAPPMETSVEELEALSRLQETIQQQQRQERQQQEDEEEEDESPRHSPVTSAPAKSPFASTTPAKSPFAPAHSQSPPPDAPAHARNPAVEQAKSGDGYATSLDKLNTSLSDLQGEIMRLSLQQEKKRPEATNVPSASSQFYGQDAGINQPSAFTQRPPAAYPTTAHPQPTYPYAPGVVSHHAPPPFAQYPQYFPPQHPRYQTSPHSIYQQQLGYPYANQQQPWPHQPPQPQQPPVAQYPQATTFTPPYTSSLPSSGVATSQMAPLSPSANRGIPSLGMPSTSEGIPVGSPLKSENTSGSSNQNSPMTVSRERERSLSPQKKPHVDSIGEGDEAALQEHSQAEPGPYEHDAVSHAGPPAEGENEGFFIAFEDSAPPKRPKPQLGKNRSAKKDTKTKKSPSASSPEKSFTPQRKE